MAKDKIIRTKYLIVGNSAGGIGAAEAIRQRDKNGSLTIVTDEPYPAYSRPMIENYLAGDATLDRMLYRPQDFYEKKDITLVAGRKAASLDLAGHKVTLDDGQSIAWEKLLLATGGRPVVPPMPGVDKKGVFTFTTLDDAKKLAQALKPGDRVVVIGGGLIGISVAKPLAKLGTHVIMVELKDRVLSTVLDAEASRMVEERLAANKVELITGQSVQEVLGSPFDQDTVGGVRLQDGRQIQCSVVIVAIGVTPRLDLVRNTGVTINRGIVVDRHMTTSHPDVYACGDVAEAYDFVLETNRLTPIWPNAYIGGKIAGYNMAGYHVEYQGGTAMNSFNYDQLSVVSAGIADPEDKAHYPVLTRKNGKPGHYRKVVLHQGRVVGLICAGDIEGSGVLLDLMRERTNVQKYRETLLEEGMGLALLPEKVRRDKLKSVNKPSAPAGAEAETDDSAMDG